MGFVIGTLTSRVTLALSALLVVAAASSVGAEPILITITSGSLSFNTDTGEGDVLTLTGTHGFSLTAFPQFGRTGPTCCLSPGATTRFRGFWSSNDLPGSATFEGDTFTRLGNFNSANQLSVDFTSSAFILPGFDTGTAINITAPFTLVGSFQGTPGDGINELPTVDLTLIGSGVGTLSLTKLPGFDLWDPGTARLQITAPPAPIPEPAPVALFALALVAARFARFRRMSTPRTAGPARPL